MPKFKNPGAEEAFQEKMEAVVGMRNGYLAELLKTVGPYGKKKVKPKRTVANKMVDHHEKNGHDVLFDEYSDFFVTVKGIILKWADIKDALEREGIHVAWNREGIWLTRKVQEARESHTKNANIIKHMVNRYNSRAEVVKQLPIFNLKLLAPRQ